MRKAILGLSCLVLVASASPPRAELEQEPFSIGSVDDSYARALEQPGPQATRDQPSSIAAKSEPAQPPAQRQERTAPAPAKEFSWWWWRPLTDY
jgi:hypothetical protein